VIALALDQQLLLAVTTSVGSATFLVGFLGNQFHRTLDSARSAAARDDDEALAANSSGISAVLERQEDESELARKGFPLDWLWLAVVATIAVAATALAIAAALVPERPVSRSAVWTVVTLVVVVWLVVSAAAWD
jgi:hypothetical protein